MTARSALERDLDELAAADDVRPLLRRRYKLHERVAEASLWYKHAAAQQQDVTTAAAAAAAWQQQQCAAAAAQQAAGVLVQHAVPATQLRAAAPAAVQLA